MVCASRLFLLAIVAWSLSMRGLLIAGPAFTVPVDDPPKKNAPRQLVLVEVFQSPVFWRAGRNDKEQEIKVDARSGTEFHIPAGGWVRCGPGGKVKLYLLPDIITYEKSEWYPLPFLTEAQSGLLETVGKGLFRRAGKPRGDAQIFSPMMHGKVWPASLVLRWEPLSEEGKVTLTVRELAGDVTTLWQRSGIDGRTGLWEDKELREALQRWRDENGADADKSRLQFIIKAKDGERKQPFDVLSAKEEQELVKALAPWDGQAKGVLRHLGRAEVFRHHGLLAESAAEYELALQGDPQGLFIRRRTAAAYEMIDDISRAQHISEKPKR
jgi:hypothetical protein